MVKLETPTRRMKNDFIYSGSSKPYSFQSEEAADNYMETHYPEWKDEWIIEEKQRKSWKNKSETIIPFEKSSLQKIFETASSEELQAAEESNRAEKLAIVAIRKDIPINKEMEIWLGTIRSASSKRTYRNGIKKLLKYCESHDIKPTLLTHNDIKIFINWLNANGASSPSIKTTVSACNKLFTELWKNHEIPEQTNPFRIKGLLHRNTERVKLLLVPDKIDANRLLEYAYTTNMVVYTAIKLIIKHGMRRGAFENMIIRGKKAVTKSKGRMHRFDLDDEDIQLLEANPLNEHTATNLGGRINYLLEQAYKKGITKEPYSAHDFRHYFAIDFFMKNKNTIICNDILIILSKKLGHSSIHTTIKYLDSLNKESL